MPSPSSVTVRRSLAGIAAVLAALVAASCGLEAGGILDDAGGPDATATDGAATNDGIAPLDDGGLGDAEPDVLLDAGPCPAPGLPLCDNASACGTGESCSPPLAPGWSLVVLNRNAGATCPSAFVPRAGNEVEFKDGTATCTCSCTKTGGSCGSGAATVMFGPSDSTCPSNAAAAPIAPDNGCADLATVQPGTATFGFKLARPTATAPTCTAVNGGTIPVADGGAVQLCDVGDASALCALHRFCVPAATGKVCIAKSGTVACPAPFVQVVVANDITGTRGCGCSCSAAGGSCIGTATLYNGGSSCGNGAPLDFPYDGGCVNVTGAAAPNYKFVTIPLDASPGGSCTPVGTTQNTAAPVNPTTVCCTP
jgi:hypothetical protein